MNFVKCKMLHFCADENKKAFMARPVSYFCPDLNCIHMGT
jgi:YHS domain-containing protein